MNQSVEGGVVVVLDLLPAPTDVIFKRYTISLGNDDAGSEAYAAIDSSRGALLASVLQAASPRGIYAELAVCKDTRNQKGLRLKAC